jgi:hypothetical protein
MFLEIKIIKSLRGGVKAGRRMQPAGLHMFSEKQMLVLTHGSGRCEV